MERERATRGTNRGAPQGIPRKTRSHQDSWMLALCCTDLTYWPLQLPCTINRDPARSARTPKERERETEKKDEKEKEESARGDVASHVVARRRIFSTHTLSLSPFFFFIPPFSWPTCPSFSFPFARELSRSLGKADGR